MPEEKGFTLKYEGCNYLRQRLILATLSGRSVEITNIRHKEDNPGLQEYEASFIRLMDAITNGSRIEVNETGTRLFYQPGLLAGGRIEHDCNTHRGIGYYLEALVCLAPFCKKAVHAVLRGVTNDPIDPSVDTFKQGTLTVLKKFLGYDEGLEFKIVKRGLPPGGGGEVLFRCPVRRQLRPIQFTDAGKIKRIRGVAYATRVSPTVVNRIVESAKGILLKFLPDVYIHSDHCHGSQAGKSPGFGITLVAETINGVFLTAEMVSNSPSSGKEPNVPENIGKTAAHLLLEEVYRGGCVGSSDQSLACLFMALGQQDVSKLLLGPLSPYTIQFLRHLKDFFQVMFKMDIRVNEDHLRIGADKILMTCVGVGFTNLSKVTS